MKLFKKDQGSWIKGKNWSPEIKEKISQPILEGYKLGRKTRNKDKAWSEEVKQKISKSLKGQTVWNKGKTLTQEHKDKISKSKSFLFGKKKDE